MGRGDVGRIWINISGPTSLSPHDLLYLVVDGLLGVVGVGLCNLGEEGVELCEGWGVRKFWIVVWLLFCTTAVIATVHQNWSHTRRVGELNILENSPVGEKASPRS